MPNSWDGFTATWNYHPNVGLNLIVRQHLAAARGQPQAKPVSRRGSVQ
jgi:hypothetical protein